ncbi:alpha/beta hydrolase [Kutzneria viridogrisea]|uniref:Pimeloyl-ACP methyl ester carboxylesterase n=1 Tax=Kutzneria viridogrisea TaxID=47990 RepID=A0ABR6BX47_9PSEU|nr:pimeloyl-ACP methyl ester carboxylesterase [Kutzneria viridogrisea]
MKALLAALVLTTSLHPTPSTVDWKPCAADPTAECTTIATQGTTLALARRRADPAQRVGTLLVNPGGPGLSGVDMVLKRPPFSAELLAKFDLVGFDPPGVGASPVDSCGLVDTPQSMPTSPQEFQNLLAANKKAAAACTAHLSDTDLARDVEAIRVALGGEPLNWYGTSYGTEIGQRYAELYPTKIRTMVLDATIDHSGSALTHLLTATASAEDTFNRFALWCTKNTACPLHGQDVAAVFEATRAKLAGDELAAFDSDTYLALYAPAQGWPWLGAMIAAGHPPRTAARPASANNAVLAAICQDWDYSVHSFAELSAIQAAAAGLAPHLRIGDVDRYRLIGCQGWPVADPPHPLRVHGAPPVLVVNSEHDPITPYAGAVHVSRQLPGSALLTYRGDGHTTYTQSKCVRDNVDRYLVTGAVPARGASCPDVVNPATAAR